MKPIFLGLLILVLQGLVSFVLPQTFSPPDFFLLAALAVGVRVNPEIGILAAVLIGFCQDLFGGGQIGLHTGALAITAYVVFWARRVLQGEQGLNALLLVTLAEIVKWLCLAMFVFWSRKNIISTETWAWVIPLEILFTLIASPAIAALARWALGPVPNSDERLL